MRAPGRKIGLVDARMIVMHGKPDFCNTDVLGLAI